MFSVYYSHLFYSSNTRVHVHPDMFRICQLVDIEVSFRALPYPDGNFHIVTHLNSVTLISRAGSLVRILFDLTTRTYLLIGVNKLTLSSTIIR